MTGKIFNQKPIKAKCITCNTEDAETNDYECYYCKSKFNRKMNNIIRNTPLYKLQMTGASSYNREYKKRNKTKQNENTKENER
ncbi:MAG: hypothetical protein ACJASR_000133 [Psychroserpens sp.]|jgi:hypothetical protein